MQLEIMSPWARAWCLVPSAMNSCLPSRLHHRIALTEPGDAMVKVGGEPSCRAGAEHLGTISRLRPSTSSSGHSCGSNSPRSRSWSRGLHSQATGAGGFVVSPTLRVGSVFYACRSVDQSPGMHSFHNDSKPELREASPSDPRHSHGTPRPSTGRSLQPCLLLI
jgi:hypothetical protein